MARSRAEPWAFITVPLKPSKRRAAEALGIHAAFDGAEGVLGQQGAELAAGIGGQLAFEQREHGQGQALAGLQDDVADEPVANDHIHAVPEQVMAFDVADEIQVQLLAELEGFQGQFIAFGVLGADAEDADAGILVAENLPGVDAAHDGVMRQVQGFALDVGAGIEQHEFIVRRGDDRGNGAAGPRRESGRSLKVAAAKMPPVLPREITASALPSWTNSTARAMEQSFFCAERGGGLVRHGQDLAGVDDAHAVVAKAALGQGGVDLASVADQVKGGNPRDRLAGPAWRLR